MVARISHPYLTVPVQLRRSSATSSSPPPAPSSLRRVAKPAKLSFKTAAAGSAAPADGGGGGGGQGPAMDFPYLSPAHRDLMLDLLSDTESRLGPHLLPSSVPPDVLSFQSDSGNCKGSLDIRHGADGSKVDLILQSWLHCELPFGVLDITTLFAYLRPESDAPHLLMEFIQNGPDSLVLFIDLLPRRDLVLHADYLDHFYQHVLSPTAIAVGINCGAEGARPLEELMRELVAGAAKEVIGVWLDRCALAEREVTEGDRTGLVARDDLIKRKTVEIDLSANLPRLFGQQVASRVVGAIQKAFGI
ncbi:unnamed protein product [Spirodela intermedia]|uniref:Uncharacterized protein n=1 Tax=Spirodela intermedia TaxID=51605 RepID=A0A7I8J4D5_SPIIN|nr:unnamed protein product [Spirodela intermedia]CAA6664969.1 unnamed protein product [Spirodela intermedia]